MDEYRKICTRPALQRVARLLCSIAAAGVQRAAQDAPVLPTRWVSGCTAHVSNKSLNLSYSGSDL